MHIKTHSFSFFFCPNENSILLLTSHSDQAKPDKIRRRVRRIGGKHRARTKMLDVETPTITAAGNLILILLFISLFYSSFFFSLK